MAHPNLLIQIVTVISIVNCLLLIVSQATPISPISSSPSDLTDHRTSAESVGATGISAAALEQQQHSPSLEPTAAVSIGTHQKIKRESKPSTSELETQETGHYLPSAYPSATESDYGYDAGKNSYGKQASDWSLYDQG
jgi:hypothetical protein